MIKIYIFFCQFFKFGLVGFSSTVLSYGVYSLLVYLGIPYIVANFLGFIIGTFNSFFLNSKFVFASDRRNKKDVFYSLFKSFICYGFVNIIISSILLFFLVEKFGVSTYIAPIITLLFTVPLNFFLNKFWTFNK